MPPVVPHWDDEFLVVPLGFQFSTASCLLCAGRDHVSIRRESARSMFSLEGHEFPGGASVPCCDSCRDRGVTTHWVAVAMITVSLIVFPAGLFFVGARIGGELMPMTGLLCGWVACRVIWRFIDRWFDRRVLKIRKSEKEAVLLTVPDPQATSRALAILLEG